MKNNDHSINESYEEYEKLLSSRCKLKGLKDYLDDDSQLTKKVSSEEFKESIKLGFDDSSVHDAYEEYEKLLSSKCKLKGLKDYLDDDPSLTEKLSFEKSETIKKEFENSSTCKTYKNVMTTEHMS